MAKESLKQKNARILISSLKFSGKRIEMKNILVSGSSTFSDKIRAQKFLEQKKLSSMIRYRNRCKITGRSRAYRGKFGMCGFKVRELSGFGMIMGVVKVG